MRSGYLICGYEEDQARGNDQSQSRDEEGRWSSVQANRIGLLGVLEEVWVGRQRREQETGVK